MKSAKLSALALTMIAASILFGCAEKPPAGAEKDAAAEPAQAAAAESFAPSEKGPKVEGALLTVEALPPREVVQAMLEVAEVFAPGISAGWFDAMNLGNDFESGEAFLNALGRKPVFFALLPPVGGYMQPPRFVVAIGAEGADAFLKSFEGDGLASIEDDAWAIGPEEAPEAFLRRKDGWFVVASTLELADSVHAEIAAGRAPAAPAKGHLSARVDMKTVRKTYGALANQSLMMAKGAVAGQFREQPMMARLMQEYIGIGQAAVNSFDEYAFAVDLSASEIVLTTTATPGASSSLAAIAREATAADWSKGRIIPEGTWVASVARLDEEAFGPLFDVISASAKRVVMDAMDPATLQELLAAYRAIVLNGELVSSNSGASFAEMSSLGMFGGGDTAAALAKLIPVILDLLNPLLEQSGMSFNANIEEGVDTIDGFRVDHYDFGFTSPDLPPEALEQIKAMSGIMQGHAALSDEAYIFASGSGSLDSLRAAVAKLKSSAGPKDALWPAASPALRRLMKSAPERTWVAGEIGLASYMRLAMSMMPPAQDMPEMDGTPVACWIASDGERLIVRQSWPMKPLAQMVQFFQAMQANMQAPPMQPGDEDFDFDFDDEDVW